MDVGRGGRRSQGGEKKAEPARGKVFLGATTVVQARGPLGEFCAGGWRRKEGNFFFLFQNHVDTQLLK